MGYLISPRNGGDTSAASVAHHPFVHGFSSLPYFQPFIVAWVQDVNHFHFTSVISACEKKGKWDIALSLLSTMKHRLVPGPSKIRWRQGGAGGMDHGQCPSLVLLGAEVLPTEVTYNAAMSACGKGGQSSVTCLLLCCSGGGGHATTARGDNTGSWDMPVTKHD